MQRLDELEREQHRIRDELTRAEEERRAAEEARDEYHKLYLETLERCRMRIPLNLGTRSDDLGIRSGALGRRIGAKRRPQWSGGSGWRGVGGSEPFLPPHGLSAQREDVSVVYEAIADRVGNGRIGKHLVPSFRRHLRSDDSG